MAKRHFLSARRPLDSILFGLGKVLIGKDVNTPFTIPREP